MPKNKEISIAHLGLLNKLRKAGRLKDPRIEAAFRQVPRHLFLPGLSIEQAYADEAIPLKKDPGGLLVSSASQPTMMSIMLEQLDLQP
ncbi:MAG: protein-L-isoaspartate(D-aspartate) O-methyltransferase, partial [Anaerolineae bacterium]|nr:protein-L-isoaspartate(D-aspartate) O-methyltransferase [Anaerolineae bacterium]